jgi:riboflavin kinase / FMN adenylyltransferase
VQIVETLEQALPQWPAMVLTIGRFDGIHRGHRQLIGQVIARARSLQAAAAVLSWDPHPSTVLQPDNPAALLTDAEEKAALLAELGVDLFLRVPFSDAVRQLTAADYLAQITAVVPLRELWIGEDFRMGHGRSGDAAELARIGAALGFSVHTGARVCADDGKIGSSAIRRLIVAGQVADAAVLLGRPYSAAGVVVQGDQRGRTIGFPTANLQLDPQVITPGNGVYACWAQLDDGARIAAVTNIGTRPTFDGLRRTVETHLLDWSGDLYGRRVRVAFVERLREEQRFAGIEALKAQIARDAVQARERLLAGEMHSR